MKSSEHILEEIQAAMTLNKTTKAKCNAALTDAINLIEHNTKELQNCLDEEYKRGMNDAWEIAIELCKTGYDECFKIFGDSSVEYVIKNFIPLEVKEKITLYRRERDNENNKVRVGDVVKHILDDKKAIILNCNTDINLNEINWNVFTENGCVESWHRENFVKTGEFVDVYNALIK